MKALRANVDALDARTRSTIQAASVMRLGPAKVAHDLILLDPPYHTGAGAVALDRLERLGWIGAATWIALETAHDEAAECRGLDVVADRKVGKGRIRLLQSTRL